MKTRIVYLLVGIFLLTNLSVFSQNKKNKKNKKSKANVEQVVVAKDSSNTIQPYKTDGKPSDIKPADSKPIETSKPSKENNISEKPIKEVKPVSANSSAFNSKPLTFSEANSVSKPVVTEKPNGSVNWTEQYVEAKGMSVIDNEKFKNPAQAKLMARRGATVDAQRNLLEIIKGVNITSETTVNDMIASSDFIYSRLDGVIKGAQLVGEPIEKDGIIELRMRVPLYEKNGLAPVVYDKIPELKNVTQTEEVNKINEALNQLPPEVKDQVMEGLTFKLNGKTYDPSMFPVIVDENNNLVLDMSKFYDPTTGKFPQILSTAENLFKEAGFDKGLDIINVIKAETGKITIDNESVKKINWSKIGNIAGKVGKFLLMLI